MLESASIDHAVFRSKLGAVVFAFEIEDVRGRRVVEDGVPSVLIGRSVIIDHDPEVENAVVGLITQTRPIEKNPEHGFAVGLGNLSRKPIDVQALMLMLGISLVVATISNHLGAALAGLGMLNSMIWAIIISSGLGMIGAPTWLGKAAGSDEVSGIMLYVIVALIGAEVSLGAIAQAPMYILSGFMILAIHAVILLLVARMLRMNLYLAAIASIANIGSAPSAAVVGAAYDRNLVPIAVIMALIGSMIGSFVGLSVAEILIWLKSG